MTARAARPSAAPQALDVEPYLAAVMARLDAALDEADESARALTAPLAPSPLLEASDLVTCIRDLVAAGGKLVRPRLVMLGYLAGLDSADGETPAHSCAAEAAPTGRPADDADGTASRPVNSTGLAIEREAPIAQGDGRAQPHLDRPTPGMPDVDDPDLARLGAAFELLHVFGLLQDDVMDASATRRGVPSAHRRVADVARSTVPAGAANDPVARLMSRSAPSTGPFEVPRDAHSGEARRTGESIAVLAGDLAFALAQREIRPLPETVTHAWDATVMELVGGQRLDIVLAAEGRFDAEATALVAQAKSGAYTVRRPLEAGALLAAPHRAMPQWLSQYGEHVGAAFALADDVIGIWGDPRVTGKPVGDDLGERKPSSVIGIADAMLDGELSRRLRPGSPRLDALETADIVDRMTTIGVRDKALAQIDEHVTAAMECTDAVRCPTLRVAFVETARTLARRSA